MYKYIIIDSNWRIRMQVITYESQVRITAVKIAIINKSLRQGVMAIVRKIREWCNE